MERRAVRDPRRYSGDLLGLTDKIIEEQGKNMEVSKLLELEVAFMNFCIKTYPSNIAYVN